VCRSQSGFTLAEIIVAAGVLGFCISAILAFFINAVALNEISRNQTTAVSHAQYVLESIRNVKLADLPTQITNKEWDWNTAAIGTEGLMALKDEAIVTTSTGTAPVTVTVTVSWSESSGRVRSFTVTTEAGGV